MMFSKKLSRREAIALTARIGFVMAVSRSFAAAPKEAKGGVIGEATAAKVGRKVLDDGGNVVDAIVAAALVAGITSPQHCGPGGYGGSMTFSRAGSSRVYCIDFNTIAPAAMTEEIFSPANGGLKSVGWLATGVPGTLAGLELAAKKFGTMPLDELFAPAIQLTRDGFPLPRGLASHLQQRAELYGKDKGMTELFYPGGEPLQAGATFRNPPLAEMLSTLVQRGSVDSFYRGDIAGEIADAFQRNDGLVTRKDMAAYRAREVKPSAIEWNGFRICTAPLTSGGLTILQALNILKALKWEREPRTLETEFARIEALRLAWRDRLTLLGDPEKEKVPASKLLSRGYARDLAEQVRDAVRARQPIRHELRPSNDDGTVNLSAVDAEGNLAALTLTHGGGFGACVAVPECGLILGNGMSRFDPNPGHPNAPGPHKQPLHNMCPTIVLEGRKPVLAIGGAGGQRIPNSIFEALTQFVARGATIREAIAAPRMQTIGSINLGLEAAWPEDQQAELKKLGYKIASDRSAFVSAAYASPRRDDFVLVAR